MTGPRPQPLSLAGIVFDSAAKFILTAYIERLREHRQKFIFSEKKLNSLPLLPDVTRFFNGQVACMFVPYHFPTPSMPDKLSLGTSTAVMLSSSSCTNCKRKFPTCAVSHLSIPVESSPWCLIGCVSTPMMNSNVSYGALSFVLSPH